VGAIHGVERKQLVPFDGGRHRVMPAARGLAVDERDWVGSYLRLEVPVNRERFILAHVRHQDAERAAVLGLSHLTDTQRRREQSVQFEPRAWICFEMQSSRHRPVRGGR
jgi:hypothetical protein